MTDGRLHHVVLGRHSFPRMKCEVIPRARRSSDGSAWGTGFPEGARRAGYARGAGSAGAWVSQNAGANMKVTTLETRLQ